MISILLSTYNSSKYLNSQLESLINQNTTLPYNIYIRDDGSTDNTVELIERYVSKVANIIFIKDQEKNLGACLSFMKLLTMVESEYFMFCDHDDIWLDTKIEVSFEALKQLENQVKSEPIIIHTDLLVVDDSLEVIHNSFWKHSKIYPDILEHPKNIPIINCVTGCTMIFNDAAKQVSLPFPTNIPMHDWWIAINTIKSGKIRHLAECTILYRQHGQNVVGANSVNINYFLIKFKNLSQTLRGNLNHYRFLRSTTNVSFLYFLYFKFYYSLLRIKKSCFG